MDLAVDVRKTEIDRENHLRRFFLVDAWIVRFCSDGSRGRGETEGESY